MAHFHDQSFRAKRRRLDTDNARSGDGNVAITSPTQLRDLLVFRQDAVQAKLGRRSEKPEAVICVDLKCLSIEKQE